MFFFTIGAIYLVYLVYLLFRAYSELRTMPYFGKTFTFTITFVRARLWVIHKKIFRKLKRNIIMFVPGPGFLNIYVGNHTC